MRTLRSLELVALFVQTQTTASPLQAEAHDEHHGMNHTTSPVHGVDASRKINGQLRIGLIGEAKVPGPIIISAGRRGCSGPVVCCIGNALAKDTLVIVWLILVGCRCFCKDDLFNKPNPTNLFTFCV